MVLDQSLFDHIGATSLQGGVNGYSFRPASNRGNLRIYFRNITTAAPHGLDIPFLSGLVYLAVYEFPDLFINPEISINEILGLIIRNIGCLSQTIRTLSVKNAEINGLGLSPHVLTHFLQSNPVDLGGGSGMNVLVVFEGLDHFFIPGQVRGQTKLDLGIIQA